MASVAQISVDEYLTKYSRSAVEFLDGVLIEKPMPTWMHSVLQAWIAALIMRQYPQYLAGGEVHARLRPGEFRLPDVAAQLRTVAQQESYAEQPLMLCVEILSPDGRLGATFAKCERYHDWGVPACWVVDPMKRRARSYLRGGEPVLSETSLEAGDIKLTLSDIFSVLDGAAH